MNLSCCLCGDSKHDRVDSFKLYAIMRCRSCELQVLYPFPEESQLVKIYSEYYNAWDLNNSGMDVSMMKRETFRSYLKRVTPYISSGTYLDIGCATGESLAVAKENGFDVYGVEVSPYGIQQCRKKFGEGRIIGEALKSTHFHADFFDLITLSDVLEHITEPGVFIGTVYNILKPGGFLMIVTPDTSSWIKKLMGKHWLHYKEEHIYYYNKQSIMKLLLPEFQITLIGKAYKILSLNYIADILSAYTHNSLSRKSVYFLKIIPAIIRKYHLRMYIGEMFILCRKSTSSPL